MLLSELLCGIGEYRLVNIGADANVTRPFCDSRSLVEGGLFVCIRGERSDGHSFAREVIEKGAALVLCEVELLGLPCAVVGDTRRAIGRIYSNFYKNPAHGMRLLGVTGTNGKTSVARFLSACLEEEGRRVCTIGTLGAFVGGERLWSGESESPDSTARMTTPDPECLYPVLARAREVGVSDVVMEVSSHAILYKKVSALEFHTGIFTNLTPEHLDLHKSMEEYFKVKRSFIAGCKSRIVNVDDDFGAVLERELDCVGVGAGNVKNARAGLDGVSYDLSLFEKKLHIESSVGGDFTVSNTLLSAAAALSLQVSSQSIERGIKGVSLVRGRMERIVKRECEGFDVICDYAHTPDALERVLLQLRSQTPGRLICVFGCGGERDRRKRPLMGSAARRLCDISFVTDDNPRNEDPFEIIAQIIGGMKGGGGEVAVIPSRREAVFLAVTCAKEGDTVALCGKGHEEYEIGREGLLPFDEREVVKTALRAKKGK